MARRLGRRLRVAAVALLVLAAPSLFILAECALHRRTPAAVEAPRSPEVARAEAAIAGYARPGAATFFTFPEWLIVYHTEEYATFIAASRPSGFPYLRSIAQYWSSYRGMCAAACGSFPFDPGDHVMLAVIGTSYSVELLIKGLYENSIGRLAEWIASNDTDEDRLAARIAGEYGRFMHRVPWYDFPFGHALRRVWSEPPLWGPHPVRKYERKLAMTLEYGFKALYGGLIHVATKASYGDEAEWIHARVERMPDAALHDDRVRRVSTLSDGSSIVALQRYEPFTVVVSRLIRDGARFDDVAGNRRILITAIAPDDPPRIDGDHGVVLYDSRLLTSARHRIAIDARLDALPSLLRRFAESSVTLEHIYDY
jgi:hypothetical protein